MRYVLLLIIVLFTFLICGVANASLCANTPERVYENWRVDVVKRNAQKELLEDYLSPPSQSEFVAAYNASPPTSKKDPANVAVWLTNQAMINHLQGNAPNGIVPHMIVVWIDKDGCILETETIPIFVMDKLLRGIPFVMDKRLQNVPFVPGGKAAARQKSALDTLECAD